METPRLEIPFDDGDRAREFYVETFGWQMVPRAGHELHHGDDRSERP